MELSGSFYGKTSNSAIKPKITWWAWENVEGNYSEVTAQLSYSRSDSYTTSGHWNGWLSIDSDRKNVSNKYVQISKNSNTVTVTHTVQVPHLDDGTKTVTISAAWTKDAIEELGADEQKPARATHGHEPDMGHDPIFIARGPGFREGAVLERAELRDIAPTLAGLWGETMPQAEGQCLRALLK